jgi:hypothetical protein
LKYRLFSDSRPVIEFDVVLAVCMLSCVFDSSLKSNHLACPLPHDDSKTVRILYLFILRLSFVIVGLRLFVSDAHVFDGRPEFETGCL